MSFREMYSRSATQFGGKLAVSLVLNICSVYISEFSYEKKNVIVVTNRLNKIINFYAS